MLYGAAIAIALLLNGGCYPAPPLSKRITTASQTAGNQTSDEQLVASVRAPSGNKSSEKVKDLPPNKRADEKKELPKASKKTPNAAPQQGIASYYSIKTNRGTATASGKPLCDKTPTAAHRTLPFGTIVRVTRIKSGKTVEIPITDRGPYIKGRIIDLNLAAARALGITPKDGIAQVKVEVVKQAVSKTKTK